MPQESPMPMASLLTIIKYLKKSFILICKTAERIERISTHSMKPKYQTKGIHSNKRKRKTSLFKILRVIQKVYDKGIKSYVSFGARKYLKSMNHFSYYKFSMTFWKSHVYMVFTKTNVPLIPVSTNFLKCAYRLKI